MENVLESNFLSMIFDDLFQIQLIVEQESDWVWLAFNQYSSREIIIFFPNQVSRK